MQKENICKFITSSEDVGLGIKKFVLERNNEILSSKTRLDYNRLYLFISGCGSIFFDKSEVFFREGSLIFAFEGENVYIKAKTECECMYIDFNGIRASELFYRFTINISNRIFDESGLIPLWQESLSRAHDSTISLVAESMLLYSFSRLDLCENKKNNVIMDMVRISEKNFSDPELSVEKIADMLDYNAKYLSHVFKKQMKISYIEYLRSLRIKYAISLFDNGIDSIKNVAFLSGFSDPMYFSTVFKRSVGKSPTEYLKK